MPARLRFSEGNQTSLNCRAKAVSQPFGCKGSENRVKYKKNAIKFNLKERKGRKEKKTSPSYSPIKVKAQEAKGENNTYIVCDADSGFDEDLLKRYEVFKKKCKKSMLGSMMVSG